MKTLATLMTIIVLAWPAPTQAQFDQMRPDIDKDIPLAEAVKRFNAQFPDPQPLTEAEVIASVQQIKTAHPDVEDAVYQMYQRVAKERVVPRGMFFSHMSSLTSDGVQYDVDWKDLTLTALPHGTKDDKIGFGFNYRIRARFISSKPLVGGVPNGRPALIKPVAAPDIR